ncbi:MAG TPA: aminotransferase class IV [Acidimicrobiia bacterium]|nr:aminotransferase class IV [Acidimicrobiia bacterium]
MRDSDLVVLVDGEESAAVPATDSSVLRGDGCFEALRSYDGRLFRPEQHLDRLGRSAAALDLEMPSRERLMAWMERVAAKGGDCIVRVVLSRGSAVPGVEGEGICIVMAHRRPARQQSVALWPVAAPWHPAGRDWELAGAKTISYAPNLAAGRRAVKRGADDALLLSDGHVVLEGPTFSVGWCRGGTVFTPALRLGILDSITRRAVLEIWPGIDEVEETLDGMLAADEVFAMSTMKEVVPVRSVGDTIFPEGPITRSLAQRFAELVAQ